MGKYKLIIVTVLTIFTFKIYSQENSMQNSELTAILCTNDSVAFTVSKGWIDKNHILSQYYANFAKEFLVSNYGYISPKLALSIKYDTYPRRLAYSFSDFLYREQFLRTKEDYYFNIIIYANTSEPEKELYKLLKYAYSNVSAIKDVKEAKGSYDLNDENLFDVLNRPLIKSEKKEIKKLKTISKQYVKQYKKQMNEPIPELRDSL